MESARAGNVAFVCRDGDVVSLSRERFLPRAPPVPTLAGSIPLPEDGFAAIRLNFTDDARYTLSVSGRVCRDPAYGGPQAVFKSIIHNGTRLSDLVSGSSHPTYAEVGALSHDVEVPELVWTSGCGGTGYSGPGWRGSITFVFASLGAPGYANYSFWIEHGLESFDVHVGQAEAYTKDEFGTGAHASTSALLTYASAGALMTQTMAPTNDFIGVFLPQRNPGGDPPTGATSHHCTRSGEPCPEAGWGGVRLQSKGPVEWSAGFDHDVQTFEPPYHALIGIEFPDASYLR